MNNQKYALVLTGELLSGFNADSAWPKLATQFHMDNERLRSEALARAPLTIKESEDLPALKSKYIVSGTIRKSDGVQVRVVSKDQPTAESRSVSPNLEDAYLYFIGGKQ